MRVRIDVPDRGDDGQLPLHLLFEHRHVVGVEDPELDLSRDHRGADVGAEAHELHLIDLEPAGPQELGERRGAGSSHRIDAHRLILEVRALIALAVGRGEEPVGMLLAVDADEIDPGIGDHPHDRRGRRKREVDVARHHRLRCGRARVEGPDLHVEALVLEEALFLGDVDEEPRKHRRDAGDGDGHLPGRVGGHRIAGRQCDQDQREETYRFAGHRGLTCPRGPWRPSTPCDRRASRRQRESSPA